MTHPYTDYLVCRNNYFDNPEEITNLALQQPYRKAAYYPGYRTENLLNFSNPEIQKFGNDFAERLSVDVFPGIRNYTISVYFHMNEAHNDSICNQGWIHRDTSLLAGLVYLTHEEKNFNNGTSIFLGNGSEDEENKKMREEFNLSGICSEEYKQCLQESWTNFTETIRFGNLYNRLIAYDSKMYHRPNQYNTETGNPRLSLVFFISKFEY